MPANRLALAALGAGCIAAAGTGGYLAMRQNVTPTPVAAAAPAAPAAATTTRPVESTEGVIPPAAPAATATPPAKTETASATAARRTESPARESARPAPTRPADRTVARATPPATPLPTLERTWPGAATMPPPPPAEVVPAQPIAPDHTTMEPAEPARQYEELVVAADSVIGLQIERPISSETARVEDPVQARVTRDVRVGNDVAIPAGTEAIGSVMQVERGGKFKEHARLGIRFHTLVLADGTRLPISTETIYRESEGPGNTAASRIGGGAVGGAIIGAILGGARGAAIGATAGAGAGTAMVAAGDRNTVTLAAGSPMTIRVLSPVTVTVEK
jgi:hypothetical protein